MVDRSSPADNRIPLSHHPAAPPSLCTQTSNNLRLAPHAANREERNLYSRVGLSWAKKKTKKRQTRRGLSPPSPPPLGLPSTYF